MANPEEIKKLLDQINKAYEKLGSGPNPFANFDTSNITNAKATTEQLEVALEGVKYKLELTNTSAKDLSDQLKSIVQEVKNTNTPAKDFEKSLKRSIVQAQKLKYEEEDISKLSKKQLEQIKEKLKQSKSDNIQNAKKLLEEIDLNGELTEQKKIAQSYLNDTEKSEDILITKVGQRIAQEEKISKLMGLGGAAVEGTQKALAKMGFGGLSKALGLYEVKEKMREIAEGFEKNGENVNSFANKFKVLKGGVKEAGNQLMTSLKDPLVVSGFLVDQMVMALKNADKATGDLAKAFNITYQESSRVREDLISMANSSGDISVSAIKLQESMIAVGKSLGSNAILNEKDLVLFTQMREKAGLTNAELVEMQKLTYVSGVNLEDNVGSLLGAAKMTGLRNGMLLNEKDIMRDIALTSKATQLSLGGSGEALGKAVAQVKMLGMNMKQVENIAGSLLDFESSISAELEAELLTGKDLNLERARLYAINNDMAGVAREIRKNYGDTAEFAKLNRIQQEAAAKAVGMTREDLAATLTDEKALAGLSGEELNKGKAALELARAQGMTESQIAKKSIEDLLKQQSIQERFNNTIEKLQEIFISIAQPLMPLLDTLASVFNIVGKIIKILDPFIQMISTALGFVTDLLSAKTYLTGDFTNTKQSASRVGESFSKNFIFSQPEPVSDMGYDNKTGKTTISTKEGGLFAVSENDQIRVEPNALNKNTINKPMSSQASLGEMIKNQQNQISEILKLQSTQSQKPIYVSAKIDGKELLSFNANNANERGNLEKRTAYNLQ
jgi:hypothetical protein